MCVLFDCLCLNRLLQGEERRVFGASGARPWRSPLRCEVVASTSSRFQRVVRAEAKRPRGKGGSLAPLASLLLCAQMALQLFRWRRQCCLTEAAGTTAAPAGCRTPTRWPENLESLSWGLGAMFPRCVSSGQGTAPQKRSSCLTEQEAASTGHGSFCTYHCQSLWCSPHAVSQVASIAAGDFKFDL